MLAGREGDFGRFMFSLLALRVGGYSARLLDMHSDFGCVSFHILCSTTLVSSLKVAWIRNNFFFFNSAFVFTSPSSSLVSVCSQPLADRTAGQKRVGGKKGLVQYDLHYPDFSLIGTHTHCFYVVY